MTNSLHYDQQASAFQPIRASDVEILHNVRMICHDELLAQRSLAILYSQVFDDGLHSDGLPVKRGGAHCAKGPGSDLITEDQCSQRCDRRL